MEPSGSLLLAWHLFSSSVFYLFLKPRGKALMKFSKCLDLISLTSSALASGNVARDRILMIQDLFLFYFPVFLKST